MYTHMFVYTHTHATTVKGKKTINHKLERQQGALSGRVWLEEREG